MKGAACLKGGIKGGIKRKELVKKCYGISGSTPVWGHTHCCEKSYDFGDSNACMGTYALLRKGHSLHA